jgi:hypothetical protein
MSLILIVHVKKSMIEWVVIFLIIFCTLVWHYSHSVSEYSFSQIKESQISMHLTRLWEERKPVIVSEVKPRGLWVADGLRQTRFWGAQPIWNTYQNDPQGFILEHNRAQQITWADILGISQIERDTLLRWYDVSPWVFSTRTEAHIGPEGLRQTYGWSTAFTCTDGAARCILLHNAQKGRLPPGWKNLRWLNATVAHHPLWTQVQNIEIILRPGTTILVPPHWIVAIEPLQPETPIWWVRTDLHHPVSSWAQRWNEI